jgi:hypothetical protein
MKQELDHEFYLSTWYSCSTPLMSKVILCVGQDSSVGIATRYTLDSPGIEFRWGEIFRIRPDRPWGPPSLLHNRFSVSFPGVKWPGRSVDHPAPSSAEVKETDELYLYSPSRPSWPVLE